MRTLAVIAFLALAFPGRAEMDALSVSCSAAPSLPSPVLVVYGSDVYKRQGYGRAARMMDLLESRGIIAPADNTNRPRKVLVE